MGRALNPEAQRLLITAAGGGSYGGRPRLWKLESARLAEEMGLEIRFCRFPPGTSKWKKPKFHAVEKEPPIGKRLVAPFQRHGFG